MRSVARAPGALAALTLVATLAPLLPHLPRLDSLGVDILWLMPVQPIGVESRKGPLGSYYSIRDYTAINPEFGTVADFRAFVDSAHALGFRVILDWVANHTAFDHAWVTEHPDWYTRRADGTISYPVGQDGKETDWTDVADLNYDSQEMRRAMLGEMRWWIDSMDVDGFRADVAWGVPYDFWASVRAEMQAARPDVFLLAEAEDPRLHEWFDATYGWTLHHGAAGGEQVPLAHDGGDRTFAVTRTGGDNTVLVALNFADAPARIAYRGLDPAGGYTDWFSKAAVELGASGTLEVPANGWRVLVR